MRLSRRTFLGTAAAATVVPLHRQLESGGRPPGDRFDPWVEVIVDSLRHNLSQVERLSGRPVLAVVKNDAYGLGLTTAASQLEPASTIAGFAVVRTDEAIALREAGVRKPVVLMARVAPSDVAELAERRIEITLFADDDATRFVTASRSQGSRIRAHFYIDTGMGRMGMRWDRALPWMIAAYGSGAFEIRGTMTELAEDAAFDHEQVTRFNDLTKRAAAAGVELGRRHAASSNGVYHLPEAHFDLVRPGMALWGGYPSRPDEERAKAELIPAVRLRARVVRVERLEPGDGVSYGRNYVASRPTWVATFPLGHVDGYPRRATAGARVLVGGRTYPVIGAVSASHCIIEVGEERTVSIGDTGTFLGPDDPAIHPNEVARRIEGSVYDLFMHLDPKLPRYVV